MLALKNRMFSKSLCIKNAPRRAQQIAQRHGPIGPRWLRVQVEPYRVGTVWGELSDGPRYLSSAGLTPRRSRLNRLSTIRRSSFAVIARNTVRWRRWTKRIRSLPHQARIWDLPGEVEASKPDGSLQTWGLDFALFEAIRPWRRNMFIRLRHAGVACMAGGRRLKPNSSFEKNRDAPPKPKLGTRVLRSQPR